MSAPVREGRVLRPSRGAPTGDSGPWLRAAVACLLAFAGATAVAGAAGAASGERAQELAGTVADSLRRPVAQVRVSVRSRNGRLVADTMTDPAGRFRIAGVAPGLYSLSARKPGFKPALMIVSVPSAQAGKLLLTLESEQALTLRLQAQLIQTPNGLSEAGVNKYTMTAEDVAQLPAGEQTTLSDVLLQMPGVALDQNQEIHVRGEHMGLQYQINGVLLPLDINADPTFLQLLIEYCTI